MYRGDYIPSALGVTEPKLPTIFLAKMAEQNTSIPRLHASSMYRVGDLGTDYPTTIKALANALKYVKEKEKLPREEDDRQVPMIQGPMEDREHWPIWPGYMWESNHRENPLIQRMENMCLDTIHQVYLIWVQEGAGDSHQLFIFTSSFDELMNDYSKRYGELAVHWHRDQTFFPTILKACYTVGQLMDVAACRICLRWFRVMNSRFIPVCSYCMGTYVDNRCKQREDRVMREFTGHIAGLADDEELKRWKHIADV
jgi:hypothetical protein